MMYVCKHFRVQELVPPQVFDDRNSLAWELLDDRLLIVLDQLRKHYGRMTVNNWYWGGDRLWSGLRTPGSPFYSPYSQHTFGRAADVLFSELPAEIVRENILANPNDFKLIRSVETGVSWLHFDVRNCESIKTYGAG